MKKIGLGILFICGISLLASCKMNEIEMINTVSADSKDIKEINVSYKSEDVRFFIGDEDEIVIEEFLESEKDKATIKTKGDKLSIESGKRKKWRFVPTLGNHVDIYLPASYHSDLNIKTNSGSIELVDSFELKKVSIEQNSGDFKLKEIKAEELSLTVKSGSLEGELLEANNLRAISNSGNIEFNKVLGNADLETKSGSISASFINVDKNVKSVSKSGDVEIELPKNLSFDFDGKITSGSFSTDYEIDVSGPDDVIKGAIGNSDKKHVMIKTTSGDISLMKRE